MDEMENQEYLAREDHKDLQALMEKTDRMVSMEQTVHLVFLDGLV